LRDDVQLYIEFLDAKRFGRSHFEQIYHLLKDKYRHMQFDAVITSDNDALDFMMLYGDDLVPDVPIVFCGINNIKDYRIDGTRYYGILEAVDMKTEINLIAKLIPGITKLYFITDSSTTSLLNMKYIRILENEYHNHLEFVYIQNCSVDSLMYAVRHFESGNAIALINYYQDNLGNPVNVEAIFKQIARISPVPVFIDFEALLGKGIAGGIMINSSAHGRQAALLALEFIDNPEFNPEKRITLPDNTYLFDYRVLEKFHIPVNSLPPKAIIINKPTGSFFHRNVRFILTLMGIVGLFILVVCLYYANIRRRKIAEKKLGQKIKEIGEKNVQLELVQSKLNEMNERLEEVNEHLSVTNEALILARQRSEESDKLKSAFLANISYQIRTPLNAIIGFAALLNDSLITEEEKTEYFRIMGSSSDQLLRIIDDIIDLSKIESGQLQISVEAFSISALFSELVETYRSFSSEKKIELKIAYPAQSNHLLMMSDRNRFRQILGNLISNAIKFTREGSVEIGYSLDIPREIVFYVRDSGIGIQEKDLKNIFNRFWKAELQGERKTSGAGVGLAICKKLSDALGGKIWVESEQSLGTTFYIAFQDYVLKKETTEDEKVLTDHIPVPLDDFTIAIVDDEKDNMYLITRMLRNLNLKIIQFHSGVEIVDYFRDGENLRIDLILMDIKMPHMDGITAAKLIREIRPSIPILAQTAYAGLDDQDKTWVSTFDDYIVKPVKPLVIIEKIRKFLTPE